MKSVTVRATIERPVEDVYDFLVDSRNDEQWCPLARNVELIEGQPGIGAVYRFEQGQAPGMPWITSFIRTIEAQRPTRIVWDNNDRGTPYRATIELAGDGGRTKIKHTNWVSLPNILQQTAWFAGANLALRMQLHNLNKALQ